MKSSTLRTWLAILIVAVFAAGVQASEVPGVHYETVEFAPAHLNGMKVKFNIIFPTGYDETKTRRYPVLYLLHGYTDDYAGWVTKSNLLEHTARFQEIIVNPEGGVSWYVNNHADPKQQWEDYLIDDLIPYVDSHYRTIADRSARAVAGLSMGGYGALLLGFKHYDKFAAAASMSGALEGAEGEFFTGVQSAQKANPNDAFMTHLVKDLADDYGPPDNPERANDDPYELIRKVPTDQMPQIYISCGENDDLIAESRRMANLLTKLKIPYEYHEVPGRHEWPLWDREIQIIMGIQAPIIGAAELQPGEYGPGWTR
jgi:putative tributyrin esterase